MSVNSKMTALADEIRVLSGTTEAMGIDAMKTHVGEANEEVGSQANLIAQIITALDGKASDGGSGDDYIPTLQDKTVIPNVSEQKITADSGYDGLGIITVAAVPTQSKSITPKSVSQDVTPDENMFLSKVTVVGDANLVASNIASGVNIFGVTGNYVGAGTPVDNYEDEILDGSLINYTNTTVSKIGNNAFQGCASLKTVNFTECSHIGQEAFTGCTALTTASFENCLSMGSSAFQECTGLTTISFPVCKSIYWAGFSGCTSLKTVNLPSCTYLGGRAFQKCTKLSTLSLPLCRQIYSSTFQSCSALTTVSLPAATMLGSTAFGSCTKLSTFYLAGSSLCGLSGSNAFTGTGITSTSGSIYVNASLVDSYKAATNWAYFSNVIYAIE